MFPLSSYMKKRGFGSLIGLGIVNCLKSQVFEWAKDSQGNTFRTLQRSVPHLIGTRVFFLNERLVETSGLLT